MLGVGRPPGEPPEMPAAGGAGDCGRRSSGGGLTGKSGARAGAGASRTVIGALSGMGAMPCHGKWVTGAASSIQCATAEAPSAAPNRATGAGETTDGGERAAPVIQGITADAVPC